MVTSTLVIQFAKWPIPGSVKTRLAKHLGDARAFQVHCELTAQVLCNLTRFKQADYQLWWDQPPHALSPDSPSGLQQLCQIVREVPMGGIPDMQQVQQGENLGARMLHALTKGLQRYQKVMIVGSDCPTVDVSYLAQAETKLNSHDMVLIPAEDGGYVLLGVRRSALTTLPGVLLADIPWGTDVVLETTLNAAKRQSLAVGLLETTWDVDENDDYLAWLDRSSALDVKTP